MDAVLKSGSNRYNFLTAALDTLKDMTSAATLQCSDEGIRIRAVSDDHVRLLDIFISKNIFESYSDPENITIEPAALAKVIRRSGASSTHFFTSMNQLHIGEHYLQMLPPPPPVPELPDFNPTASFTTQFNALNSILQAIVCMYDTATITVREMKLKFSEDTSSVGKIEITHEIIDSIGKAKASYNVTYLLSMTKHFKKFRFTDVRIKFGNDTPIEISCAEYGIDIKYTLAPRATSDEI